MSLCSSAVDGHVYWACIPINLSKAQICQKILSLLFTLVNLFSHLWIYTQTKFCPNPSALLLALALQRPKSGVDLVTQVKFGLHRQKPKFFNAGNTNQHIYFLSVIRYFKNVHGQNFKISMFVKADSESLGDSGANLYGYFFLLFIKFVSSLQANLDYILYVKVLDYILKMK